MEALFLKLVNMSITASWLVLAIIAVRLIFKKAPKWIFCLLWGLVAFRLVCPFSIESGLSLIPDAEPLSQESAYTSETVKQAHGEILDSEGNVIVQRNPAANGDILDFKGNVVVEIQDGIRVYPEETQTHNWLHFLSRIWLAGFAVMLAYTAVSYYLLKQKVATAIPLVKGIKQSEYVDSPFVLGIIHPVIYLPFDMAEADCAYVISHEKAHIRRRDHWWKPLGFLLLSVYWFNPVLWVAYILLCRDIEAACDEKVIQDMEKDERRAYSTALLNCSIHRRRIAACPLAFGETGVKARVKSVMNYKKPAFWVIMIALIICIVVAVCFLTNPKDVLPITMYADYVSRTRADLKFLFAEELLEDGYQISEFYNLESMVDGTWQELTGAFDKKPREEVFETQSGNSEYNAWTVLNWEDHYGSLPDGTYRIRKEITVIGESGEPETNPVYLEFTVGGTPDAYVTFTLEDITPIGAKLFEHEKVKDSTQLVYDGDVGIWLESQQDSQWNYMEATQYIEPILRKEKYSIHQTHYSDYIQLDWSTIYGELPDGSYRIAREITNTAEDDLRVCTAYVEFTISRSPVTISLENVRPDGARILFNQNKDLIDGKLLCDREFFLEQQIDGQWVDMKEGSIPLDVEDDPYDIALLSHQDVNWSSTYGILPVGTYRLGKVIPVTSGENPEYTTVYVEFSIDHVYTWFDRYSGDANEHSAKDNLVELFGLENVTLSYNPAENTIYLINADGREPIITCDVVFRNVFLTDLTGDGISEVCATVQNDNTTEVQVYDASEQKLYELPAEGSGYKLTKKADRLCIYRNDEVYGNPVDYWQLFLEHDRGIALEDLDPEVEALKSKLVCVDVNTKKRVCLSSTQQLNQAVTLLQDLRDTVKPATAAELEEAEKDGANINWITVNYELGEKNLFFSRNFDLVWEVGSTEAFRIPDPEPIRLFMASVTNGVRNKETSGEAFATVDAPWDWCAGVNPEAISDAEVYACMDKTSNGSGYSVSSTNGILPSENLQQLIPVLNQIPKEAFTDSERAEQTFRWFAHVQTEGSASISVIDGVNQLAVAIRLSDGQVEMIMTEELDKAQDSTAEYLNPAAKIWRIQDPSLRGYLSRIAKDPPVINYSVGAEYDWQEPIHFSKGTFNLKLNLISDWIYEEVKNSTNSGIRCRPKDVEEGWIYFSFWPNGYDVKEEDRYYGDGSWNGFPVIWSYPSSVKSSTGVDTRHAIWSYEVVNTDIGDFAIINDGADNWFLEYEDQISDTLSLITFTTE